MSEFIGLVTTIGQQKIAAAIGGAALNLTTIRVGDGNGVPIVPTPGMTDLVRRVGKAYPIISSGRDLTNATHWRVTALIPAEDGPFDIREIGVFDAAGDMIAIARHVLVEKRSPDQGAAVELTTDIVFPVSETAQVVVQIQPSAAVSILQLLRAGFITVESAQVSAPPANPALGASYVVAANPTGAWAGLTNRLAQWNGTVWVSVDPPQGFLVVAQDRALDHDERWLRRSAGGWTSARATDDALGGVELATVEEVLEGKDGKRVVTPATLASMSLAIVDIANSGAIVKIPTFGRNLVIISVAQTFVVPPDVNNLFVEVWGGGGGGGASHPPAPCGGGGGDAGGYARKLCHVTPGEQIVCTIGAGGTGGISNGANGTAGGTTSFGTYCAATGGQPGIGGTAGALGNGSGVPGVGSGGDLNLPGSPGKVASPPTPSIAWTAGGNGGDAPFIGGGAQGGYFATRNGGPGAGGAGGGSYVGNTNKGGAGGKGQIIISY